MKRLSFQHGVVLAGALAFFASAVIAALTPFVGFGTVVRFVIPALGLAYLLFLFSRSRERVGRITTMSCWCILAVLTVWLDPALPVYLLIHVSAVWLVRSLYFYAGILPALLDLGLSALSISSAVWAFTRSGSPFLATWCFFLVQSLFVAIPSSVKKKSVSVRSMPGHRDKFERAKHQADRALRQIVTRRDSYKPIRED